MEIAITQIEKYRNTLENLKTTLDKGEKVNLSKFASENHVNPVFFTVLKRKNMVAKTNGLTAWNSSVEPNNRMAVAVIKEIRTLQRGQRSVRKAKGKFERPIFKDEVRMKRAYNKKPKTEDTHSVIEEITAVETTLDVLPKKVKRPYNRKPKVEVEPVVDANPIVEVPAQEVVEGFYYNPLVEVAPESISDHLPVEEAPIVSKTEKRTYTKAVKKVEEVESISKIYFLGMKIITIKKTVKKS